MGFTFETGGNNTFLVYEIQPEDKLDSMALGMITNNRIPGLAAALYTQMNRERYLKFNVTARVTVKQFFSGVINRRRLLGVFSGVAEALASAEEYMIDYADLLLDPDYIYVDVSTCRAEVVCLPLILETEPVDAGKFFKNIMFTTQFDQTEDCGYVARIINYLNSTPMFVTEDFRKLLEQLRAETAQGAVRLQPASQAGPVQGLIQAQPVSQAGSGQELIQAQTASQGEPGQGAVQVQPVSQTGPGQDALPPGKVSSKKAGNETARPQAGFAIPGQGGENGFAVPGMGVTQQKESPEADSQPVSEKKMSMFYLLQHYNKENAAAYKAQKAAQKKGGKSVSDDSAGPGKADGPGFRIPGQQGIQSEPQQAAAPRQSQQPRAMSSQQIHVQAAPSMQPSPQSATMAKPPFQPVPEGDNFGDTVVLGAADGDTVVLGNTAASCTQPYLHRISNHERILINKPIFHIGKERSYVDYCVSGNATVSRSHADIISRDGQYFIVDNNSTNHTYVDGDRIPSNTEIPLTHGAKIRLSDEEFEFMLF